jgi:molecular chaperone HtpG
MTTASREQLTFQADTARLLHLMVHSLYTSKEIFLRELISNASDALDRLRLEAFAHPEWDTSGAPRIVIDVDRDARTLTVSDNGIGMRRADVIAYLGTIASSLTREMRERETTQGAELIGQFGVGFYSSFMVADRVVVITRHPDEPEGVRWECAADSSEYTIESVEAPPRGTSITLFLMPVSRDAGLEDFTDRWVLTRLVKRHSDFIAYPILLNERPREAPQPDDAASEPPVDASRPLNSMKPIWTRPTSEVSTEEYHEFYKHLTHDWREPWHHLLIKAEGRIEYQALLFIPSEAPSDLYYHAAKSGLELYARRVLIMEHCQELLPGYLRFLKGIVDSADLPLHISRQMLQQNQHVTQIRKWLTRKTLDMLADLHTKEPARYLEFWKQFGRVLKEGIGTDRENHDRLVPRLLFASSHAPADDADALTTLAGYVARMKPDQPEIYYLTGESRTVVEHMPQLEAFREKGYEVLYLTDPVDELVVQSLTTFDGKPLRSAQTTNVSMGDEEERRTRDAELEAATQEFAPLLEALQKALDADVRTVKLSPRLVNAAACLVHDDFDYSPQLERLLLKGKGGGPKRRRILEVNPRHAIIQQLRTRLDESATIERFARLLLGYALLAEGSELTDHLGFTEALAAMMADQALVQPQERSDGGR